MFERFKNRSTADDGATATTVDDDRDRGAVTTADDDRDRGAVATADERPVTTADVPPEERTAAHPRGTVTRETIYRARSTIAQTLQASLLPPMLPEVPGADAGAVYEAAGEDHEVGGDFYDLFATSEDHWFAVIGDVCGKGAEAAAVTALTRYTIRAAAARRHSPAAILRWVNEVMVREASTRFCTVAIAHLDRSAGRSDLTVAVGGHPSPIVVRADGRVEELDGSGTLLGLVDDPKLDDMTTELLPGDTVLLYTDGVTEAGAPHRVWTPADLIELVAGCAPGYAQQLVDHVAEATLKDLDGPPRDDIAMLALRIAPA